MPYSPLMVKPMRDELTSIGVGELMSATDVDRFMEEANDGTSLLIVNSVCGCAAGGARPALARALQHAVRPEAVYTVFAGQDLDATARVRSYFSDYQPSSPCFMLVKDGEMAEMIHRHQIEGRSPDQVAAMLTAAFDAHCGVGAEGRA